MNATTNYDCAIIGGGVAGLSLAILLAKAGKSVILFEKEQYPFHKVCGEYISNESVAFIARLGLNLNDLDLPRIDSLLLSSASGVAIQRPLSIGGIGFSRYRLDEILSRLAIENGVEIRANTRVKKIAFENDQFLIVTDEHSIQAKIACGAFGKNSNIDAQLNRMIRAEGRDLFVAVKYHIEMDYGRTRVEMHNFDGGYCGMSAIEDGKVNMSYIAKAERLRACDNKIPEMEKTILSKNPFLKRYFDSARFLFEKPLVISHLHFGLKTAVDHHLLMVGDAAGNIAPLSGNGISMAFRSAAIAASLIDSFLNKQISRTDLETSYSRQYRKVFSGRISSARMIHHTFGKPILNRLSFHLLRAFPFLIDMAQKRIHGPKY